MSILKAGNNTTLPRPVLKKALVLLAAALLIPACMTLPKPLYFTLDMSGTDQGRAADVLKPDREVEVDAIRVTDKLVRRDVLIQEDATEYEYYHDAKWIERVPDLVAQKLESEFRRSNEESGTAVKHEPAVFVLYGTLLAFEQADSKDGKTYAHIQLDAQIRRKGDSRQNVVFERMYSYYEPVDAPSPLPKMVVDKLSEGMEHIADEIAKDVNALAL